MYMDRIKDEKYMSEGMDMRRFFLCLYKKLWIIIAVTVLGALLGAAVYLLYKNVIHGEKVYEISSDYYITFNEKDYPKGMDYYNAYTWNEFVVDDRIVEPVLAMIPGMDKQFVIDSVSSRMPSDYRVLTVVVEGTDTEKIQAINEAYKSAMPAFADEVGELSTIELWSENEMYPVKNNDKAKNAAILGALIGLIIAAFAFGVYYCMDDRIYTEKDFVSHFPEVPFIGYDTKAYANDTQANRQMVIGEADVYETSDVSADIEEIKKHDGCVLKLAFGKTHITAVEYDIQLIGKQGGKLCGVLLGDCDEKFLKRYYGKQQR